MSSPSAFAVVVTIVLFVLKFSLGFNTDLKHLLYFREHRGLLIRSLLVDLVLVPLVAVGMIMLLDLPFSVSAALLLLSASPGAPLAPYKALKAAGNYPYGISLQFWLVLFSIVTVPAWLEGFDALFDLGIHALPRKVAGQLVLAVLLPLGLGLLARRLFPRLSDRIGPVILKIANVLLLAVGLVLLVLMRKLLLESDLTALLSFLGFLFLALLAGHLFGGPLAKDRTTLAIMTSSRNIGIAMFVAAQNFDQQAVLATVIPYLVVAMVVSMGYTAWRKRREAGPA